MYIEITKHKKVTEIFMAGLLLISVTVLAMKPEWFVSKKKDTVLKERITKTQQQKNGYSIVIDPGHGGKDPGKVGGAGTLEKEVNLRISRQLKRILEEKGYRVKMTRTEDCHLGTVRFRKMEDLNERCRIINHTYQDNAQTVMISIHQNSFEKSSVTGAQCFYYHKSQQSKALAESVQKELNEKINTSGSKKEKGNDNYYMLINSQCPGIIIECGFLSNSEEEEKLAKEEYQKLLSEVIAEGIADYFKEEGHFS